MKPSREFDHLQYQVIASSQLAALQNQVASWMCRNWIPYGNFAVVANSDGSKDYYQPMIYDHDRANAKAKAKAK